jgi:hypothetical protein
MSETGTEFPCVETKLAIPNFGCPTDDPRQNIRARAGPPRTGVARIDQGELAANGYLKRCRGERVEKGDAVRFYIVPKHRRVAPAAGANHTNGCLSPPAPMAGPASK